MIAHTPGKTGTIAAMYTHLLCTLWVPGHNQKLESSPFSIPKAVFFDMRLCPVKETVCTHSGLGPPL